MFRKIFKRKKNFGLLRNFSIYERVYGSTSEVKFENYGDAYNYYSDSLIKNFNKNSHKNSLTDKTLINDLRLLRGLRFGLDHNSEKTKEIFKILISRANICEEDLISKYLQLFNFIGFRSEKLYEAFFNSIKLNFEGMKYTNQLKCLYQWSKSDVFIYSYQIEEKIKDRFFGRSTRRFSKLEANELAMLTWVLSSWGIDVKELLEFEEMKLDFNSLMANQSLELNQYMELGFLLATKKLNFGDLNFDKEEPPETFHNIVKLLETFCVLGPIQYDNILREADNKYYNDQGIGSFDPVTEQSAYLGFKISDLLGMEPREFNYHFEDIINRKLENDLIELNTASKIVALDVQRITPNCKAQVYHNIAEMFEKEASIVPISIFPENLNILVREVLKDMKTGFIKKSTLVRISAAVIAFIARDEFDEHLSEINDLVNFKELIGLDNLGLESSLIEKAKENIELNDF